MRLARRQQKANRIPEGIDHGMDLCAQSAPAASDRFFAVTVFFGCARAVVGGTHDGVVDHSVFIIGISRQSLENSLPNTTLCPPPEALSRVFCSVTNRATSPRPSWLKAQDANVCDSCVPYHKRTMVAQAILTDSDRSRSGKRLRMKHAGVPNCRHRSRHRPAGLGARGSDLATRLCAPAARTGDRQRL